jgi:hypothetical protein
MMVSPERSPTVWRIALPLVIAFCCLGVLTTFVNPPFHVPDEQAHWIVANRRAADLVGSKLEKCDAAITLNATLGSVAQQPQERMPRGRYAHLADPVANCDTPPMDVPYGSVLTYFGVVLSRAVVRGESVSQQQSLAVFLLARLFHGLFIAAILLRIAVFSSKATDSRGVGFGSLCLLAFCCSPLFLQQSFAVSSDPICFAWALSVSTFVLFWPRLKVGDVVLHVLCTLVVAPTKPTLLPAGLTALFFAFLLHSPVFKDGLVAAWQERLGGRDWLKNRTVYLFASYVVAFILAVAVTLTIRGAEGSLHFPDGVDPVAQRAFLSTHPWASATAIAKALAYVALPHLQVGPLGWLDFSPSIATALCWFALLVQGGAGDVSQFLGARTNSTVEVRQAGASTFVVLAGLVLFLCASVLSVAAIGYAMFLFHTAVGSSKVGGLQPRYMTPLWMIGMSVGFATISRLMPQVDFPACRRFVSSKWIRGISGSLLLLTTVCYLTYLSIDFAVRYW